MVVGALVGTAWLVAACGHPTPGRSVAHIGSTVPTTTKVPAAGAGPFGANLQQMYQETLADAGCMRTHGLPSFPDPVLVDNSHEKGITMPGSVNQNSSAYKAANHACEHLLPNGGQGPSSAQMAAALARLLKAAQCMRAHVVPNFPGPTESDGGQAVGFRMSGIDLNSAQFQAAQKACRSLSALLGGG